MMRKKNNMRHRNGGGRRHHNGGGRSGGNDGQNVARQKHHATQMREKYFNLARDAQSNGDRVDVEYYLQHVDHYVRVLADISAIEAERFAERQAQQQADQANGVAHAEATDDAGDSGNDNADSGGAGPVDLGNQPRMTRAPRQQHGNSQQSSAAKEIPLPGSILTEIPV